MKNSLKIISLGGWGEVTQNMFVYETDNDLIVVDCGLGFPNEEARGVDLVIPDITYLKEKVGKLRAIILSHGHEDHIGGLPYILPQLPKNLPVFGPRWAIALTEEKLKEFGLRGNLRQIDEESKLDLGGFSLEFIKVTHSLPDTFHLVIKTPVGVIYHAADFKLDLTPVVGSPTHQEKIQKVGRQGVLCLLSDSLRAENPGFTPPEAKLEEMFNKEMANCQGKFFVTTISSNISRLKQAIDVSLRLGRKVVLVGRSIETNIKLAERLKYLRFSPDTFVKKEKIGNYPANRLTLLVAGSQAQTGSSLDKIVAGEVKSVKVEPTDKIIFSTDFIPGNEKAIYQLIDNLYRQGANVIYQDIHSDVHVSGHGFKEDLGKLMKMVNPRFMIPIGGNFRHLVAYQRLAKEKGFAENQVILADDGQVVEFFEGGRVDTTQKIETRQILVDALGVGDVGPVVLRDRKVMAEEGMVVIVLPIDQSSHDLQSDPEVITRGFIYIKESLDFLEKTKEKIRQVVKDVKGKRMDYHFVRRQVKEELEEFFFKATGRHPLVLPVIIEV